MERFETFTLLVSKLSRSIRKIKSEEMAEFGLKGPHVSCLYYLSQCGGLTASELCERCEEDKAAVSRSLDYLEKNGYVTCAEGSRRYRSPLELTEKGAAVCRVLNEKIERVVEAASRGLSNRERQIMYGAMAVISDHLDEIAEKLKTERRSVTPCRIHKGEREYEGSGHCRFHRLDMPEHSRSACRVVPLTVHFGEESLLMA